MYFLTDYTGKNDFKTIYFRMGVCMRARGCVSLYSFIYLLKF